MSVLCSKCGVSLSWNYALEAEAKEHGHPVFCKKCAKKHRKENQNNDNCDCESCHRAEQQKMKEDGM